ncbi:MAG: arginine--tRNA ligase [Oscillatoriales cyanobacterium SM2_1_8]|nr:arginine--tRNA ligase [Oscillatoriales cyanobacterium SM2_1_8]
MTAIAPSLLQELASRLEWAGAKTFGAVGQTLGQTVTPAKDLRFGDYQCNGPLTLAKTLGQKPREVATALLAALDVADFCEAPTIDGPGFLNFRLKPDFLAQRLQTMQRGDRLGIPPVPHPQKIILDFSSPNIAKEMHVGHLRSTILGDCLARVLSFWGHEVLRLNHVGDWGTQFGMLITHLQTTHPAALDQADALALGDLVALYRAAKARFDEDAAFREASRLAVVDLQSGEPMARLAWQLLCEQSRREFQKIYDGLGVHLTERGESFYNPYLKAVVQDLAALGLLQEDQGAQCVFLEGFLNKEGQPLPLIVQKSDGGYNYATTDLAAVRYRVTQDRAQRLIYVTDAGQADHFAAVFQVAQRAGWLPPTVEAVHVPFGLVLGEDGKKFRTRSGDTVSLQSLLDEAIARAAADWQSRNPGQPVPEEVVRTMAMGAIKYADLSQNRTSNYVFSYDKMLSLQGNTAPYLLYAYVRVQGIGRKGDLDFAQLADGLFTFADETEITLAKHLVQLPEVLMAVASDLYPNRLCQYLFELSQKFNQFYDRLPVLAAPEPERASRLGLCDLTAKVLRQGLELLGISVLEKM